MIVADLEKKTGLVSASTKELKELEALEPLHFIAEMIANAKLGEQGCEKTSWNLLKEESQIEALTEAGLLFKHWKDEELYQGRMRGRPKKLDLIELDKPLLIV